MPQLIRAIVTALLGTAILTTACTPIPLGPALLKRYDRDGNEVAFIFRLDASNVTSISSSGDATMSGASIGSVAGSGSKFGTVSGAIGGGLIGAAVSAVRDSGKLKVTITDRWIGYERYSGVVLATEVIIREPWEGWQRLKRGSWARVVREKDGVIVVACDPVCPAIPDPYGKFPAPEGEIKAKLDPQSQTAKELVARAAYLKERAEKSVPSTSAAPEKR